MEESKASHDSRTQQGLSERRHWCHHCHQGHHWIWMKWLTRWKLLATWICPSPGLLVDFFLLLRSHGIKVRVKGKSESRPRVWFRGHWSDRRRLLQVIGEKPFRLCSILKILGEMDLQNSENGFIDFNCETRSQYVFCFNLKQELCPGIKAGALRAWRQSWRRWSEKPSRSPRASCRRRRWQPLQWIFWISD